MTVTPVNSTDRFSPRTASRITAATKNAMEIMFSTVTWRMNGMSRLILNSSMV